MCSNTVFAQRRESGSELAATVTVVRLYLPLGVFSWDFDSPGCPVPGSVAAVVTLRSTRVVTSPRVVRRYESCASVTGFSVVVRSTIFVKPYSSVSAVFVWYVPAPASGAAAWKLLGIPSSVIVTASSTSSKMVFAHLAESGVAEASTSVTVRL